MYILTERTNFNNSLQIEAYEDKIKALNAMSEVAQASLKHFVDDYGKEKCRMSNGADTYTVTYNPGTENEPIYTINYEVREVEVIK